MSCGVWFVHEWIIRAFFLYFNECIMQMSYANAMIGLTNALCNHCALYAIDRLLTTDLDVHFLWMQTKCYTSLDFSFSMQMLFYKDADAKCPYDAHVSFHRCNFHDADVPCDGANAMFIHDGASARIYPWCKCLLTEMEMQNVLWCKCLLMGMSWCKCFL